MNFQLLIYSVIFVVICGEPGNNVPENVAFKEKLKRQETNSNFISSVRNFRLNNRNFETKPKLRTDLPRSKEPHRTPQFLATLQLKNLDENYVFKNSKPNFIQHVWNFESNSKSSSNLGGNIELLKTSQHTGTLKNEKATNPIVYKEKPKKLKINNNKIKQNIENFKAKKPFEIQQDLNAYKNTVENIDFEKGQLNLKLVEENFKKKTQHFESKFKIANDLFKHKEHFETHQHLVTLKVKNSIASINFKKEKFKSQIRKQHFKQNAQSLEFKPEILASKGKEPQATKKNLATLKPNKTTIELLKLKATDTLKIFQKLEDNLSFRKLKSLEYLFKVDTIVLYGQWENSLKFRQIFDSNHPPIIQITGLVDWKLKDLFSSNILSVVFLESEYPLGKQLLKTLKESLKEEHLQKIIIITQTFIKKEKISAGFRQIFKWLHDNGFWQSLLMDLEGNTLTFDHLIGEFKRNLSIEEFLRTDINWLDLKGFAMNCAVASDPPRAFITRDSQNNIILKGYYGNIINLFVKHFNATLNPVVISNEVNYTELDCVKYINAQKVDICGDGMPIHPEYVIAYADEIVASYLIVPCGTPLPRFYYFLKPFQPKVWSLVACSFVFLVIILSIIHRLQYGSWNVGLHLLHALLTVLFLSFDLKHVKGSYRRFLEIKMILFGFVVANWYLAVLSSLLFKRMYFHDINTLQDLVSYNISIMVDEFEYYLLNASENDPIIMQQLKVVPTDILFEHRRNLDPHYAYYTQYDKIDFYLQQQKYLLRPGMKVLTGIPPINEVIGNIPMSPNWPFKHLLSDFVRRMSDSGLYIPLLSNALEEGILSGYLHYFPTEYQYVEPLSIEYFQMPAILLVLGYSLGFVVFLLELVVALKLKKK